MDDYYAILGVHPQAGQEALARAWRIAARRNHPDRWAHEGHDSELAAHKKMVMINVAYQTLSNPERRRRYDLAMGLIAARCSRCGQPGALRDAGNGSAVALCDACLAGS